jgi:hypothetical protein
MSDVGVWTVSITSTLQDKPPKSTKSTYTQSFTITFIDPCLTTTVVYPSPNIVDMTTSVKFAGPHPTHTFVNFLDNVSYVYGET